MRSRAVICCIIMVCAVSTARAEDARLRSEILKGIDLIFNADISGGEKAFAAIEQSEPENPAPYVYRAMALMSYPPREGMKGIDRR